MVGEMLYEITVGFGDGPPCTWAEGLVISLLYRRLLSRKGDGPGLLWTSFSWTPWTSFLKVAKHAAVSFL